MLQAVINSIEGQKRTPGIGNAVVWHNAENQAFNALITCVWSDTCVNLVIVSNDDARQDAYGRQVERKTSQVHASQMTAPGYYWHYADEAPKEFSSPAAV